jgi:hypothetical protein
MGPFFLETIFRYFLKFFIGEKSFSSEANAALSEGVS